MTLVRTQFLHAAAAIDHAAQPFDGRGDFVTVFEVGLAGHTDAGRCAGENEVAGGEGAGGGEVGDDFGNGENEVVGAAVLPGVAVDLAANGEVVGVGQQVGGKAGAM